MTDKPNCSNCPKEHTQKCPIDFEKSNGNSDIFDGMNRVTRNCLMGCHPGAREWLMRDVITELELQANDFDQEDEHEYGKYCGFKDALSLIKGVKE